MTILELREKRAKAWDAAKAFLDSHRTDKGTLSAEDDAAYSRMEQDITDLGKEIARMERREALDAELNKPVSQPITGKPAGDQQAEKKGRASDEYKRNFWNAMRLQGQRPTRSATPCRIGTDSEGGYLVPDEYERTLVQALEEENVFRQPGQGHPDLQRRPQDPHGDHVTAPLSGWMRRTHSPRAMRCSTRPLCRRLQAGYLPEGVR